MVDSIKNLPVIYQGGGLPKALGHKNPVHMAKKLANAMHIRAFVVLTQALSEHICALPTKQKQMRVNINDIITYDAIFNNFFKPPKGLEIVAKKAYDSFFDKEALVSALVAQEKVGPFGRIPERWGIWLKDTGFTIQYDTNSLNLVRTSAPNQKITPFTLDGVGLRTFPAFWRRQKTQAKYYRTLYRNVVSIKCDEALAESKIFAQIQSLRERLEPQEGKIALTPSQWLKVMEKYKLSGRELQGLATLQVQDNAYKEFISFTFEFDADKIDRLPGDDFDIVNALIEEGVLSTPLFSGKVGFTSFFPTHDQDAFEAFVYTVEHLLNVDKLHRNILIFPQKRMHASLNDGLAILGLERAQYGVKAPSRSFLPEGLTIHFDSRIVTPKTLFRRGKRFFLRNWRACMRKLEAATS